MILGMSWVDIFGNTSVFLLFAWFCSSLLENRWPIASTLIGISLYGVILPILSESPVFVDNVPSAIRYAIIMLSFWAYVRLCYEGRYKEKLITYCLGYTIINVCQVLTTNLLTMFRVSIADNMEWLMAISCAMAFAVMYMVSKTWQSISLVIGQTKFTSFFLLPICQFVLIVLVVFMMTKNSGINYLLQAGEYRWVVLGIGAVFLLSLVADGMVIENVAKMADGIKAQEQLKTLELEQRMTYDYIKAVEKDITEMRRYRHDFLNMLTAVQLTIENGSNNHEEALTLIRQMTNEIGSVTGKHYCECNIINCILAFEEKRLVEQGIKCDFRANVPENLKINELDLCRVMTNIFDNAREACIREPEGKKMVTANVCVTEGYLYVTVRNTHSGDGVTTGTSKKDKKVHGQGVAILREITNRNSGDLIVNNEPDAVTVTATFRCGE